MVNISQRNEGPRKNMLTLPYPFTVQKWFTRFRREQRTSVTGTEQTSSIVAPGTSCGAERFEARKLMGSVSFTNSHCIIYSDRCQRYLKPRFCRTCIRAG